MGEALALGILQVVTPVAIAVLPGIWKEVQTICRSIPRSPWHSSRNDHLACIITIFDTLDRLDDHSWIVESHHQALLNQMHSKALSLRRMIDNDSVLMRLFHKRRYTKYFLYIAVMMQLLESNVRVRQPQTFSHQSNVNGATHNCSVIQFHEDRRANLRRDLRDTLREDPLVPVIIPTRTLNSEAESSSFERSGTYHKITYFFPAEGGASSDSTRTLTISRGVRDCIELLLKWLRDLNPMQETQNTGSSVLVGVALYELFTEVLPQVLMEHLAASQSSLHPHADHQFYRNVTFYRSFSVSPTFEAIQGAHGLELEEEAKVLHVDLRDKAWVTWEKLESRALERAQAATTTTTRTPSGHISYVCPICALYIAGKEVDNELGRHWEACFTRSLKNGCPVCHRGMEHMSEGERAAHVNECLDLPRS